MGSGTDTFKPYGDTADGGDGWYPDKISLPLTIQGDPNSGANDGIHKVHVVHEEGQLSFMRKGSWPSSSTL